jgi:hypothetical protein
MNAPRSILKHVAFGFASGVAISVAPFELNLLLVPGLLVAWVLAAKRRPVGSALASYGLVGIAALGVISIAIYLPVKYLDRKVGPIRYERMSLEALCQALREDYRVSAHAPYPEGTNIFIEFHTDRAMARREVLQKLANDTTCDLRIGFCGNGASFLFGAYPSFARLYLKSAQDGSMNPSQRVGSGTNQKTSAAGPGG